MREEFSSNVHFGRRAISYPPVITLPLIYLEFLLEEPLPRCKTQEFVQTNGPYRSSVSQKKIADPKIIFAL